MQNTHNIIYKLLLLTGVLFVLTVSCEKTLNTDVNLPRPFTLTDVDIKAAETQVVISWPASLFSAGKEVTYTVQVSKDQTFQTVDKEVNTDTTTVTFTDAQLTTKQTYYARVKVISATGVDSKQWIVSSSFMITGEQLFLPVLDAELKDKTVILRWKAATGLTKIVITPNGGAAVDVLLDATDLANGFKLISSLTGSTQYTAEIFKVAVTKGQITFTTKAPSIFTKTITPADNLVAVVAAAVNGDVIGLEDGTYNSVDGLGAFTNLVISGKTISLQSVSGDPAKVKVNYKEITLKGTGAGLTIKSIEFDGAPSTASGQQALYFINVTGLNADGEAATLTNLTVENCRVHDMGNTFMRANRGTANGDHKIGAITIKNSLIYNSAKINNNYSLLQINKLQFASISVTNSTLYNIGRAFVDWDANFAVTPRPTILVDHTTINNFGMAAMTFILFDVNTNDVDVTMQNSIFMNAPYPGETVGSLIRATNAVIKIINSNYTKLTDGQAAPVALTIPANVTLTSNQAIDLGWTAATTDFTLPAASPLRTASTTGGAIGDPRWAF
jgi:Domain of unknown function (DUF4957)/Domain of unknown function (DUF5123)/Tissue factor